MVSEVEFMDRKGSCQEGSLVASGLLASESGGGTEWHKGMCVVIDPGNSQWLPFSSMQLG